MMVLEQTYNVLSHKKIQLCCGVRYKYYTEIYTIFNGAENVSQQNKKNILNLNK